MAIVRTAYAGKMKRPDPKVWGDKWVVDLRSWGHGQRYALGPATMAREEALHLTYALLAGLKGDRMAEASQERDLFSERAPGLFAAALDSWQAQKRYDREGSKRWGDTYSRIVRRDLGAYKLADFTPPDGHARLTSYVDQLARRGDSGRTIRNKLWCAEQVLRFAVQQGWLPTAPLHPRMPPKAAPIFRWLSETMFRALRGEIFRGISVGEMHRCAEVTDEVTLRLYVEKRRMYLSWLFYTGVHHADADSASADQLFMDGGAYIRHNHKSSRAVPDEQFEMPEPLRSDFEALCDLLDRPLYPGEAFTGGPWPEVSKVMQKASKRLGFPHGANPSILRRSYAREMFLRGYSVREVADRMGHADERMLREIYVRTPRPEGRPKTRWTAGASHSPGMPPGGMARVISLKGGAE